MQLNLKAFQFQKERKLLVTEISDLPTGFQITNEIEIRSELTGRTERFRYIGVDRTPDGEDVAGWRYRPVADLARVNEVLIIND